MLPPSSLALLIRRFQAARAKAEELAREVAEALGLAAAGSAMAAPAVTRREKRVEVDEVPEPTGRYRGPWRMRQVVDVMRKTREPVGPRQLCAQIPALSMASAYTMLGRGVAEKRMVRTGKGLYVLADTPAALPAIMQQAVREERKGEGKRKGKKSGTKPGYLKPDGHPAAVMALAARNGGLVDSAAVRKAGIKLIRKDGKDGVTIILSGLAARGQLVRIGKGQYATPEKAAVLKKNHTG